LPLAVLLLPPLTAALAPLAVLSTPPLTEDKSPLAVLPKPPPLTEEKLPLAVLLLPPLTEANTPLISFRWPTTSPPKLEKLLNLPTTTSCEPVRLSMQKGTVDPVEHTGISRRDSL
jgi:hypothetical protein